MIADVLEWLGRMFGFTCCAALLLVLCWLLWVTVDVVNWRYKRWREKRMRRLCGPCVHLHFSRYDGYACEAHYSGNCTPETQECYYPSDY